MLSHPTDERLIFLGLPGMAHSWPYRGSAVRALQRMSAIPPLPPFRRGVSDVDPLYRSRVGRASPAVHRGSRDAQSEHQRIATQGGWITLSYRPQAPLADMKQIPVPRAKGNDAVGRQIP